MARNAELSVAEGGSRRRTQTQDKPAHQARAGHPSARPLSDRSPAGSQSTLALESLMKAYCYASTYLGTTGPQDEQRQERPLAASSSAARTARHCLCRSAWLSRRTPLALFKARVRLTLAGLLVASSSPSKPSVVIYPVSRSRATPTDEDWSEKKPEAHVGASRAICACLAVH
ncbi:hypothetical protein VTO73DRAFT_10338 [Trametes versicolor]